MSWLKSCLVLLSSLLLLSVSVVNVAAFWGGDYLVKINGEEFTDQDYRNWWSEWQEPEMKVHESVDQYIDFMLLAGEAEDMQLFDNPTYRKKLTVFLKVRALMQLKAEEIDANKVIPPREELWQAYLKEYAPILNLRMIAVQQEEQANVLSQFMSQGVAFDKLAESAGLSKVAEQLESTGPMRYTRIPEPLRDAVLPLQQGETVGPVKYGHAWYFLEVMERQNGSDEDFEGLKQNLIRASLKRQEAQLTQQLVARLRSDYDVQVDEALIASIGPKGPAKTDLDKVAIRIGELNVTAKLVFSSIEKTQKTRGHAKRGAEAFEESKARIVNDILVQVLTEKEALSRQYEEVPPLKPVYDFYAKYRLIKEFEQTVVKPQVIVTDEDIQTYFRNNQELFSRQGMLEYAQVTTNEQELAERISQQLKNGADFFTLMQPISPAGVPTKNEPLELLRPKIQEAVKPLASGQIATVVDGENTHFIKIIRQAETQVLPLQQVREMIIKSLEKQIFEDVRAGYIQLLRDRSAIKINRGAWERLRKELLEEAAS